MADSGRGGADTYTEGVVLKSNAYGVDGEYLEAASLAILVQ